MAFHNVLTEEIWEELKCVKCSMYLSVKPLWILEEGTNVCGRCYSKYETDENRVLLIHAVSLERFLSKLLIPCSNALHGCIRMLKLDKCQDHEDGCPFKTYHCPCMPRRSCTWSGNGENLMEHFRNSHAALTVTDNQFDLLFDSDIEINRLLFTLGRLFLVQMKMSTNKNILYGCVKFLGPSRHAQDYMYSFEFSDASNVSSFVSAVHTNTKLTENDHILSLDQNSAVHVNVNEMLSMVGFSKKVSCTVKVKHGEQRRSATPDPSDEMLRCKWPGCYRVLSVTEHQKHHSTCPLRKTTCKWEGCNHVCHGDEIHHHLTVCENRIHSCRWDGCTDVIPYKNIEDHEEICEKRLTTVYDCDVIDGTGHCDVHLPLNEFIDHIKEKHSNMFFESTRVHRTESLWSGSHFFMIAYDEFFRCKCTFACGIDGFKFEAICYATEKRARDFRLEVEILHPTNPSKSLTIHSEIVSSHAHTPKYAHVESIRPIRQYIQHNNISFNFTILTHIEYSHKQ